MMSFLRVFSSLLLLLAFSVLCLAQGNSWCSSGSDTSGTTGETPTDLSAGFCRSWTFASNIADNKLRALGLDGGATASDGNPDHTYMVSAALDQPFNLTDGSNWQLTLLPSSVPNLKGSALWSTSDNSSMFVYGGRTAGIDQSLLPSGNQIPMLEIASNQWTESTSVLSLDRLNAGAWVNVPELNKAYYLGGYQSEGTSRSITDTDLHFSPSMIEFDTVAKAPRSIAAPFLPVQNGAVFFIPKSKGLLIYFGGEAPADTVAGSSTTYTVNPWNYVWVYDIEGDKWYQQSTSGSAPSPRTEFCGSVHYDNATDSWQIHAIGGADYSTQQVLDTVDVLSIPSFRWFSASKAVTRMSTSCVQVGPQVFIIGGRTEFTSTGGPDYGSAAVIYDAEKQDVITTYQPSSTAYAAPSSVRDVIGASSTPASWGDQALQALFVASTSSGSSSTPTSGSGGDGNSGSGSGSGSSTGGDSSLSGGAIAGIAIGAVAGIALLVGASFFLVRRRRRAASAGGETFVREKSELDAQNTEVKGPSQVFEASYGTPRPKYEMDDTSLRDERGDRIGPAHELA